MSTKVYTGFKFKTNDVYEARKQIREFKQKLFEFAQGLYYNLKVTEAVMAIDLYSAGLMEKKVDHPLSSASDVIINQQEQIQARGIRNPIYDLSFSMTIFPIEAEDREGEMYCPRTILGMYFCDNAQIVDFFKTFDQFWEPYEYEDQTDLMEEELGKEEYNKRGYHWELALPFEGVPAMTGFSIDLIPIENSMFFTFRENAPDPMNFIPSFEDRCRSVAREKIGSEIVSRAQDPSQISMIEVMQAVRDESKISEAIKEIRPKLKNKLSKVDLYGFDPDKKE